MNTKPKRQLVRRYKPIWLRLPDEERDKTIAYVQSDGRSIGNFAARLFSRALAQYEQSLEKAA